MDGFELHVRPDEGRLVFQLSRRGRQGGGVPESAHPVDREPLLRRCEQLAQRVEEWSRRGELREGELDAFQRDTALLHDHLIPPALRSTIAAIDGQALWLRLRGWAVDVPWEWLSDRAGPWCLRMALGREVPVAHAASILPPSSPRTPARCAVLGDPRGDLPAASVEVDAVRKVLRAVGLRPRSQAGSLLADELKVAFRAADLLHVAAHVRDHDGSPSIECADGQLSGEDIVGLAGSSHFPALAVLNGCGSAKLAPALLGAGCGHVVATHTEVGDEIARAVALEFYRVLSRGRSFGEALRRARGQAPAWPLTAPYLLYGDPLADMAVAFPSADRAEDIDPLSPRAVVAATLLVQSRSPDESIGDELAPHRERIEACLRQANLDFQWTRETLIATLSLERFGDRVGDAALEIARCLSNLGIDEEIRSWRGSTRVVLSVGISASPSRTVEHATWLTSEAGGGGVFADDRLRALTRNPDVRWVPLPASSGRSAWRLSFLPSRSEVPRVLVGRSAAVGDLFEALDEASSTDEPELTVLQGQAGIGKSTVLLAYAQELKKRGRDVVFGRARVLGGFAVERMPRSTDIFVPGLVRQLVASAVGDDPGDEAWAWADALRRLEPQAVWLIDGVELLPEAFDAELYALLDELSSVPLHIVVALRSDTEEQRERAHRLSARAATGVKQLPPLRAGACRKLLKQRLAMDALPGELEPVVQTAQGNPLLLLEGLDAVRRAGNLGRNGSFDPARGARRSPSPLEEAMVGARLAHLDGAVRTVVEATAVLGGEAPEEALSTMPLIEASAIEAAVQAGHLGRRMAASWQGREAWCSLRDKLAARVLPSLIAPGRARALHDGALAWHEHRQSPPAQRAHHALRSSDPLQAIPPLWEEAQARHEGGDFDGALDALDTLERLTATTPEDELPMGTPAAAMVRAQREAAERMLHVEGDPTSTSVVSFFVTGGFEPVTGRQLGRYQLVDILGVNRIGVRYVAEEGTFRRKVELLVLHKQLAASESFLEVFQFQVASAARLAHPNTAAAIDLGEEDGAWYLATQFARAATLRSILKDNPSGLPADLALEIAAGLARGLAHAHGQRDEAGELVPVLHQDLNPRTAEVSADGVPRLRDFGLGAAMDAPGAPSEAGALRGRAGYLAPERGLEPLGPAADQWGLGVLLYELITGSPLFAGRTIQEVLDRVESADLSPAWRRAEAIDPQLGDWMRRLLQRSPSARLVDTAELAAELQSLSVRLSPFNQAPTKRLTEMVRRLLDDR